ncbi:hypothetical protein BLJAPNOD_05584 [Ensifer sp. M14]|nr:hypothetical protein BLJAPNOD_05584 [Ensifer sp. M14]
MRAWSERPNPAQRAQARMLPMPEIPRPHNLNTVFALRPAEFRASIAAAGPKMRAERISSCQRASLADAHRPRRCLAVRNALLEDFGLSVTPRAHVEDDLSSGALGRIMIWPTTESRGSNSSSAGIGRMTRSACFRGAPTRESVNVENHRFALPPLVRSLSKETARWQRSCSEAPRRRIRPGWPK